MTTDFYGELAARCLISRGLLKQQLYTIVYGGDVDPWMTHIIMEEFRKMSGLHATVVGRRWWDDTGRLEVISATRPMH